MCQAVRDGLAFLEERFPVCQQGLDFLEQLMLHYPQFPGCIYRHPGYVLFTQKLLIIEKHKLNTTYLQW